MHLFTAQQPEHCHSWVQYLIFMWVKFMSQLFTGGHVPLYLLIHSSYTVSNYYKILCNMYGMTILSQKLKYLISASLVSGQMSLQCNKETLDRVLVQTSFKLHALPYYILVYIYPSSKWTELCSPIITHWTVFSQIGRVCIISSVNGVPQQCIRL